MNLLAMWGYKFSQAHIPMGCNYLSNITLIGKEYLDKYPMAFKNRYITCVVHLILHCKAFWILKAEPRAIIHEIKVSICLTKGAVVWEKSQTCGTSSVAILAHLRGITIGRFRLWFCTCSVIIENIKLWRNLATRYAALQWPIRNSKVACRACVNTCHSITSLPFIIWVGRAGNRTFAYWLCVKISWIAWSTISVTWTRFAWSWTLLARILWWGICEIVISILAPL
jgi:hypothetical protein